MDYRVGSSRTQLSQHELQSRRRDVVVKPSCEMSLRSDANCALQIIFTMNVYVDESEGDFPVPGLPTAADRSVAQFILTKYCGSNWLVDLAVVKIGIRSLYTRRDACVTQAK